MDLVVVPIEGERIAKTNFVRPIFAYFSRKTGLAPSKLALVGGGSRMEADGSYAEECGWMMVWFQLEADGLVPAGNGKAKPF